jgi:hypothetical protein
MNKESLVKEKVEYQSVGEQISHELAAKMVKDHHDKYSDESKSYVIGKTIIDQILAQPGCVAVRFFDAINESGIKTLVYVGIDSNGKNILEITTVNDYGKLAVTEGMSADRGQTGLNWFS